MKGVGFYETDFMKIKEEDDLIAESIIRILTTSPGERPNRPSFGCELRKLVFENQAAIQVDDVKRIINKAISTFEPRVNLKNIDISSADNMLFVKLEFTKVKQPNQINTIEIGINLE